MNLPNYFLADLPPEAALTPTMLTEACQTLKRNRRQYLANRPTHSLLDTLAELAANWQVPDDPFRARALAEGPAVTGFSAATLRRGLDAFFRRLSYDALHGLVLQDLGQLERLDRFVTTEAELRSGRTALATGPELLVHFGAGNVPNPSLLSIILGLLTRSAQLVKCARGGDLLPRLFAHSLYAVEPKLASCLELAVWPGGDAALEEVVFHQADCITATGSEETLADLRRRVPGSARLLGYGHRLSFGYLSREALTRFHARELAALAAADVAAWDQLGCLSPQVLYVEHGGAVTPELFAEMLAGALETLEASEPRAPLPAATAATIATRRALYQVRAANSPGTRLWFSPDSTAWTVVLEDDPQFQVSCLHRFVYVKGVAGLSEALHAAAAVQPVVSCVGLAAIGNRAQELALELARWGVSRICPVGRMQDPPLAWRHDGRPALADLVRWTDWEQ